ncbi:MAG: electron transport complex subunit RsxC [Actinobacteria bacterium]|nr:electron transport complex subunit RsxC [Actinomycetota bacterium]
MNMNIISRKPRFVTGLKLKENKKSEHEPIATIPVPGRVIIPMQMHAGAECELIVKKGDTVKTGQVIGEFSSFISAKIHSSITGTVKSVLKTVNPATSTIINAVEIEALHDSEGNRAAEEKTYNDSIIIENPEDFKVFMSETDNASAAELIAKIKDAGIVGLGGAAFPTHIKLSVPEGKKIDTVILNGCECEPYITADHRMMLEYAMQILCGAYIIFKILNPIKVIIAIENNKEDAIRLMADRIRELGLENIFYISALPSKYPMGAEKTLIKNILKRKVPAGSLPLDVGVVVQNVSTAKAIFDAVAFNKPLIERVITVTGGIDKPLNLMIRIGTLVGDLKKYFGTFSDKPHDVIFGGPMTGFSVANMNFPIVKGTGCVLVQEGRKLVEKNCIRCGRCVSVCPMNLMPLMYGIYAKNNKWEECRDYYIDSCIECGSCAYVCPSSIPLVGYIKTGKSVLARK